MVTRIDIVQEQIRIAAGEPLAFRQEDIRVDGWAIECRINAENPFNGFVPSIGRVSALAQPTGPGVRVDSGLYEGLEITPYYDSLISKLVCWGETRGEAILRMRRALEEYRIMGVKTTIPFHQRLLDSHRFMGGQFDTSFVNERLPLSSPSIDPDDARVAAILATLVVHQRQVRRAVEDRPGSTSRWRWSSPAGGWPK